jgi:glycosyltransferase involved in cell wall biosynthesis
MTRPARALWIIDYFPRPHDRTTGVWALETVLALRRQGVEVAVFSPTPWIPRALAWTPRLRGWAGAPAAWDIDGVPVRFGRAPHYPHRLVTRWLYHPVPWLDSGLVWAACRGAIGRALREFSPDVVHANFIFPGGYLGWRIKRQHGVPLVVHERSPQRLDAARRHAWRGRIYRRVIADADAVITMNHQMAGTLRAMAPSQRAVHVIRSGARLPSAGAARVARSGRYQGKPMIVSVGALSERKGHAFLIQAVDALRRNGLPDVRCLIIGRGPRDAALRAQIASAGLQEHVELAGQRPHDEVLAAVSACDVFALPSWGESSGTAYAEALAFGRPIIACEGEGLSEIIRDGENGLLVAPRDAASLAAALRRVLSDAAFAARIGAQGRIVAEQEMNYDAIAGRIRRIYEDAAQGRAAHA